MPIEITRKGYIEVYKDGAYVSRHTSEWEAIESLSEEGDGDYEIRFPLIVAKAYGVLNPNTGDVTPPSAPGSVQSSATSATTGTTTWTASTDDVGVAGYQVFVDGVPQDTTTGLSYNHTGLSPSTQYAVSVVAFDSSGNNSAAGGPALFTTDSNSAPVWSLGNQAYETSTAVNIDLDTVCTDADGDTITYSLVSGSLPSGLSLSGTRNETLSGTVDTVEVAIFTLGASDGIANVQPVALTFTITAPDTTAPNAPGGVVIAGTTSSTISLDWSDNTESDLNHYDVYRSTVGSSGPWGQRNGSPLTSSAYIDSGLSEQTQYWYYITATDDSDNESLASSVVTDTTDAASSEPYNLSGFSIPYTITWPTAPTTTRSVTVNSASEFNAEAAVAQSEITIGSAFTGNMSISANDISVLNPNHHLVNGSISLSTGLSRVKLSGLYNLNDGGIWQWSGVNDVLIDDCKFNTSFNFAQNGLVGCNRVALVNTTVWNSYDSTTQQFTLFQNPNTSAARHEDFILANVRIDNGWNRPTRMQWCSRLTVVDSAFNLERGHILNSAPPASGQDGFRYSQGVLDTYYDNNVDFGNIFVNTFGSDAVGWACRNATFNNCSAYNDIQTFFQGQSAANTGTVTGCTLYASNGASLPFDTGSFTDGGGNTVQLWTGFASSLPDYTLYGASH